MQPNFAIASETKKDGYITFLAIDTSKATYRGIPWRTLGDFGKRKFRNLLVLARPKERLKISYV